MIALKRILVATDFSETADVIADAPSAKA